MGEEWKYFAYPKAKPPFYKITTVPTKEKMHYETIARCSNEDDAKSIIADHNRIAVLAKKDSEIERLRMALKIIKKNIKAGAVNLFWVRDFVTKTLNP